MELLTQSQNRLAEVNRLIAKWQGHSNDPYLNAVQSAFVGGMVGGSGRNNYALNKRRERNLTKTIEAARHLTPLYDEQRDLEQLIQEIESGEYERKKLAKATVAQTQAQRLAAYWNSLKPGDEIHNGAIIVKKNKKSIETKLCKWTAIEIIGKEAAALI